jgi:putative Mg2+ transporter-C (MgtC) family protein
MSPDLIVTLRLLLAAVLGGAIGFQRERAGKPAGLRTHMLICIGALCLL